MFPITMLLAFVVGVFGLASINVIHVTSLEALARIAIGLWFIATAIFVHVITREKTLAMIPPSLPFRQQAVTVTGIFEALGGIGLLIPNPTIQMVSSVGLVLLLIVMFPANIYVAVKTPSLDHWVRLPFQPLFIIWILWSGAYILH
jgi:uncharacterized membrane protein